MFVCLWVQDDCSEPPRKRARPNEGPPTDPDDVHDGVWGSVPCATEAAAATTEAGRKRARSSGDEDGPGPRRRRLGRDSSESSMAQDDNGNQVGRAPFLSSGSNL